jgi:hypothetical protein
MSWQLVGDIAPLFLVDFFNKSCLFWRKFLFIFWRILLFPFKIFCVNWMPFSDLSGSPYGRGHEQPTEQHRHHQQHQLKNIKVKLELMPKVWLSPLLSHCSEKTGRYYTLKNMKVKLELMPKVWLCPLLSHCSEKKLEDMIPCNLLLFDFLSKRSENIQHF